MKKLTIFALIVLLGAAPAVACDSDADVAAGTRCDEAPPFEPDLDRPREADEDPIDQDPVDPPEEESEPTLDNGRGDTCDSDDC